MISRAIFANGHLEGGRSCAEGEDIGEKVEEESSLSSVAVMLGCGKETRVVNATVCLCGRGKDWHDERGHSQTDRGDE